MTENEKLRALLAEARYACESLEFEPCSENRKHARNLKAQIDAALAEPVVDACTDECRKAKEQWAYLDEKCGIFSSLCDDMKKERDEARAEVERLRKAVHTRACRNQSAYNLECVCGADEHQRDLQKLAYRRGAEAMREAAAQAVEREVDASDCVDVIRALPVPEDK